MSLAVCAVQVAVGEDGLLEGCVGPGVSPSVRQLLDGVLEQGRELAPEEIEVLFKGRHLCRAAQVCDCKACGAVHQLHSGNDRHVFSSSAL